MKIGYARVSTDDQNLAMQLDALRAAGCEKIHEDKASGVLNGRKGLSEALKSCASGDVLVVWKLDRLARSLHDLVVIAADLKSRSVGLKILTGEGAAVDTTHPQGRMVFGILAVMAEFERELMSERTVAGMEAAKRRGVRLGRPLKLSEYQRREGASMLDAGKSRADVAALFGVHVGTLRRALKGPDDLGGSPSKGEPSGLCTGQKTGLASRLHFDRTGPKFAYGSIPRSSSCRMVDRTCPLSAGV